jgi:hypothetical protein
MSWTHFTDMGVLGFISTLIFGLLSVYLYFKGRRFRRLSVVYSSATLQSRSHPDIAITFRGVEVGLFSRAIVCLWNSGTEAIRTTDLPSESAVQITLGECRQLLAASTLCSPSESRSLSVSQQSNAAVVKFGFLNPGDGVVVELLYESSGAAHRTAIDLVAPVIDAKPAVLYEYAYGPSQIGLRHHLSMISGTAMALLAVLGSSFGAMLGKASIKYIILATVVLAGLTFWPAVADNPGSRLPKFARGFFPAKAA